MENIGKARLISIAAFAVWAGEALGSAPSSIEIAPQKPTSSHVIDITLLGIWPNTCTPTASAILASGNDIYFDVILNSALMRPCVIIDTPWQQTQSIGPLKSGTYSVYARHIEHPLWGPPYPVPVPDPNLYERITQFNVTASIRTHGYIFDPEHSTVVQTGGFAGIKERHLIKGQFQLTIDYDSGQARFDEVDAILSESGYLPTRDLGDLFRMTDMVGTLVKDTVVTFETSPLPGGISGNLELTLDDGTAQLVGRFEEPWVDGFSFDLNAIASKKAMTFYVSGTSGADDNDGLSPETAFATIQKGIGSACDGDTIIVYPGLYKENINFLGKNLTLTSTEPTVPAVVHDTKIDGSVCFSGTEDPSCVLIGFTIHSTISGFDRQADPQGKNHTHATISYCALENIATGCGGVITGCDGTINNCLIANIIYACKRAWPVPQIVGCHGLIRNCTFVNMRDGIEIFEHGTTTIRNCIIYQSSPIIVRGGGTLDIAYTDLQGGKGSILDSGNVKWGPGNADADPLFAQPAGWPDEGDYHLKSQAGRWDPAGRRWTADDVTSPCIDAGDPLDPVGLEAFPNGGVINMGAYGGTAESSKSFLGEAGCEATESGFIGDIDGTIGVGFGDLALLANYWLDTGVGLIADITDDNDVDYGDLQALAGNWLCGCDQIRSFSAFPYSVYFDCNPVVADATINSFDPETVSYFWQYIDELQDTGTIDMAEPNELQDCDEPESCSAIYLTDTEKKRIHAAKAAHSVWLDKNDILAWNIRTYSEDELAGLFDETLLFSRNGSRHYFFSVVDHSPSEVYDYLAGNELLKGNIFNTFYAVLDDLRSDFRHGNTGDGNRNTAYTVREALTTYAAYDRRVSRRGCHSMTRIAIALLRSVNIPGEETTGGEWFEVGHSSAVWPTLEYVLPHGDNIYNGLLRATPVDKFLPTLTFYQINLGTEPCKASLVCLSHRHMSLNAIRYPSDWTLDRCCDFTRYGYDNCRDYIYDRHSSYLTAEEMDAAATELEGLCGTR